MVDGILAALSPEFSLVELEVLAELWDWGMDNDADLHEVLTEPSRGAVRSYLRAAVPQVTNENDPTGAVRAHLAVAISRVADPEDIAASPRFGIGDRENTRITGSPSRAGTASSLRRVRRCATRTDTCWR